MNLFNEFYFEEECVKNIDFENLEIKLQEIKNLLQYKEEFKSFSLAGLFSLIAISKKIYRNPSDIDIAISPQEILPFLRKVEKDWLWAFTTAPGNNAVFFLKSFLNGEYKKFASANLHRGSFKAEEADIFIINNGKSQIYESKYSGNTYSDLLKGCQPNWVYHNPNETTLYDLPFFEEKEHLLKIGFFTKRDPSSEFGACLIFYNENFDTEEIINCNFLRDASQDTAYWFSPFLQKGKFEKKFYKIMVFKLDYHFTLVSKKNKILMDVWATPSSENEDVYFLNEKTQASSAVFHAKKKWKRKKDLEDIEFYSDFLLLDKPKAEDYVLKRAKMQLEI